MAKKKPVKKPKVSRVTVWKYKKLGLDVLDKDGRPDADKINAIADEQKAIGKSGTSRSETALKADERYRRAKADKMELEYQEASRLVVRREAVVREWRTRVVGLRTLLVGLGRELAPRVVGKSAREVQALIDVRAFEILRTFAHQDYMPKVEQE